MQSQLREAGEKGSVSNKGSSGFCSIGTLCCEDFMIVLHAAFGRSWHGADRSHVCHPCTSFNPGGSHPLEMPGAMETNVEARPSPHVQLLMNTPPPSSSQKSIMFNVQLSFFCRTPDMESFPEEAMFISSMGALRIGQAEELRRRCVPCPLGHRGRCK